MSNYRTEEEYQDNRLQFMEEEFDVIKKDVKDLKILDSFES
jgi:hypothetical protein